ncbi:MAG: 6-carboxytetrahydropterin synthase [Bacteroidetes bacterium]|nr:6-carboxytetrahydropterin synthase [Bacteroidota bacterium]
MKTPIVCVTRQLHFSSAHRLFNQAFSAGKNSEIFGKCNNENGHGHNYTIEVTVRGPVDPETGYVIDLKVLKSVVDELIVDDCDHKHLNFDVPWLTGIIPTAENLVVAFWNRLQPKIIQGKLHAIRLYETERNFVDYFGE